MKRDDIWIVAGSKDYAGKPRPVVIVQDDKSKETTENVGDAAVNGIPAAITVPCIFTRMPHAKIACRVDVARCCTWKTFPSGRAQSQSVRRTCCAEYVRRASRNSSLRVRLSRCASASAICASSGGRLIVQTSDFLCSLIFSNFLFL